jgi:hypothetical protein
MTLPIMMISLSALGQLCTSETQTDSIPNACPFTTRQAFIARLTSLGSGNRGGGDT